MPVRHLGRDNRCSDERNRVRVLLLRRGQRMAMKEVALKGLTHAASDDRLVRRFEVMVQQVDRVDKLTDKYFVLDEPDQHYSSVHFS